MSSDNIMTGFLLYGDNPKTLQQVWSVITRTEPPVLCLYTAPQVGISVIENDVNLTMIYCILDFYRVLISLCIELLFLWNCL